MRSSRAADAAASTLACAAGRLQPARARRSVSRSLARSLTFSADQAASRTDCVLVRQWIVVIEPCRTPTCARATSRRAARARLSGRGDRCPPRRARSAPPWGAARARCARAHLVKEELDDGGDAVGRAARGRDDAVQLGLVDLLVDAEHDVWHALVLRGRRARRGSERKRERQREERGKATAASGARLPGKAHAYVLATCGGAALRPEVERTLTGAETTTRLAPLSRKGCSLAAVTNLPVHSITMVTPSSASGISAGVLYLVNLIVLPSTVIDLSSCDTCRADKRARRGAISRCGGAAPGARRARPASANGEIAETARACRCAATRGVRRFHTSALWQPRRTLPSQNRPWCVSYSVR